MAQAKRFGDWAVKLHAKTAQAAAAVMIDGILSQGVHPNLRSGLVGSDSSPYNTWGSLMAGGPMARFSTNDLKAFLDACGVTGMLVDADGAHPGVVMYWQKYAEAGTREILASGTHISATIPNGLLVPRGITLPHQGNAEVSAELLARQLGAVAPLTWNEAANLDAGVYPATSVLWTLGKVMLNAVQVEGVKSASIDLGIGAYTEGSDSDIYPTVTGIERIQPSVRLSSVHPDITATLTEDGVAYAATQVVLYARKRAEGGSFVADVTPEHIKFTLGKCRVECVGVAGSPKTIDVLITPWYTAGVSPVSPIAINTASAIT
jgi:hypothetical protein